MSSVLGDEITGEKAIVETRVVASPETDCMPIPATQQLHFEACTQQKHTERLVHSSLMYNSRILETTQVPIDNRKDKSVVTFFTQWSNMEQLA